MTEGAAPKLSVVMTVVDGLAATDKAIDALRHQTDAPELELILPYDDSIREIAGLADKYPDVRFVEMGPVTPEHPIDNPAGQHELFDRRRAAGLAVATGDLIAILEDRGVPRPTWARTAVQLHDQPHAVVGGAVENGVDDLLNWAVYFCDFSRYQLPLAAGPRDYVTDVNIVYKRSALEKTQSLWKGRYHETTVNWSLLRDGDTLFLSPELVVDQERKGLHLPQLLSERYHWGRLFAYTRARESSRRQRALRLAMSPLLPTVLLLRHGRTQWDKRAHFPQYVRALPYVAALLTAWTVGEAEGYLKGKP